MVGVDGLPVDDVEDFLAYLTARVHRRTRFRATPTTCATSSSGWDR
ncbi:hypothetical protein NKH18_07365 [Streptomyces sp. M10(2022)]